MPSILVINPNSSASVTNSVSRSCDAFAATRPEIEISILQAPAHAPKSIDDFVTSVLSAAACFKTLQSLKLVDKHDGFIIACYSDHPLIQMLREGELCIFALMKVDRSEIGRTTGF